MKIRLDFVTNSSSSSFVCYAIRSPELAELIEACNCKEYIEACSFIETGPEGIVVNREIGAFYDVSDLDLHIDKLGLAVAIGDTESEYAANDFRYTEEHEAEDAKKVLDWDMVRTAVEEFLDDDFDTEEKILDLIDELPADSVTCKIFEAQTDGDSFYGYDNFFRSTFGASSDSAFTVVDGTITEYHPENEWYEGGRCEEYIWRNIGKNAFEKTKIFSVDFGPGCETIGKEAFKNCSKLCEVNFSEFHTYFGEYSFENCKKLPSVIELKCPWLREIPEGMFKGCTSIKKVILPASIRKIGKCAFEGCTSLQEIVFNGILDEIGENAFKGCTLLKNHPEAGIEYGPDIWTELHKKFMYSQDGLLYKYLGRDKRVVLPGKIDGTFITGIYCNAFNDSTQIEELIFSDGFEDIDLGHSDNENKFENLKYIYLPDSVSVIRERSFANCVNLKGLYIPASVEQIGDCAFAECPNLENVYLAGGKGIYASALNTSHSPRLVIRGEAKSLAQKYAKRANVPFVIDTRNRETIEAMLLAEARGQVSDNDFWEYDETITPEKELKSVLKDIDEAYETLEIIPENSNQFSKYLKGITLHRFMKLVSEVYNKPLIPWLTENGYINPMTDEEKLEFIYKKLKERYPEGSELPGSVGEIKHKNSDIILTTFDKLLATVEGKTEKEWFTEKGFLVTKETKQAEKASKAAEEKATKAAAEKAALLETLKNVEKRDESVLTERYKAVLERTLAKLEEFYPEHKTYAMDSLCSGARENAVILSMDLGYNSVIEFLYAYGYEPVSGTEVYELRKNCGYTPGNEPSVVKTRVDNTIEKLNEYYPDHIIEEAIQKSHSSLADTIAGLWQWLGYKDSTAFLAAYGFTYTAKAGGQVKVDPAAIIDELKRRYPEGTDMSVQQITADNKDLSIKTLSNTAHQLFGMKLSDYLYEQGILSNPPRGYSGYKRPEKPTSVQSGVTESVAEEKIESTTEISVISETKAEIQVAESHADKDDETILKEYTELLTSRIGTYPKKNISFEDLKFFNSDISFGALNRITIKLYGEKAIRYCTRMGFMKDKEEEQ